MRSQAGPCQSLWMVSPSRVSTGTLLSEKQSFNDLFFCVQCKNQITATFIIMCYTISWVKGHHQYKPSINHQACRHVIYTFQY